MTVLAQPCKAITMSSAFLPWGGVGLNILSKGLESAIYESLEFFIPGSKVALGAVRTLVEAVWPEGAIREQADSPPPAYLSYACAGRITMDLTFTQLKQVNYNIWFNNTLTALNNYVAAAQRNDPEAADYIYTAKENLDNFINDALLVRTNTSSAMPVTSIINSLIPAAFLHLGVYREILTFGYVTGDDQTNGRFPTGIALAMEDLYVKYQGLFKDAWDQLVDKRSSYISVSYSDGGGIQCRGY